MNKRQLIDEIRQHNSTAQPQFLAQFDEQALQQYLSHLEEARAKHLRLEVMSAARKDLRAVS